MELPTALVPATATNPRRLLIYSKPKIGKTPIAAQVPNSLLINLEKGRADFVTALKVGVNSINELGAVGVAIKKIFAETGAWPYETLIIDTTSALEEMCIPYAEILYANTGQGKNWFARAADGKIALDKSGVPVPGEGRLKYGGLLNMPEGYGYSWLREAFFKTLDFIETLSPQTIYMGHVKDILGEKSSNNISSIDVDLYGKTKQILARRCDGMGYMHRGKNSTNLLSFKSTDEQACGTTSTHLSGKEIIISQLDRVSGVLTTYWDRIYLPTGAAAPLDASEQPELLDDATAAPAEDATPVLALVPEPDVMAVAALPVAPLQVAPLQVAA